MPDSIIAEPVAKVNVTAADSFIVVSLWRAKEGDGTSYDYQTHGTLNEALDAYRELENNEYPRARAVGIFAARNGMPIAGGQIEPARLMRLMRETRAS